MCRGLVAEIRADINGAQIERAVHAQGHLMRSCNHQNVWLALLRSILTAQWDVSRTIFIEA